MHTSEVIRRPARKKKVVEVSGVLVAITYPRNDHSFPIGRSVPLSAEIKQGNREGIHLEWTLEPENRDHEDLVLEKVGVLEGSQVQLKTKGLPAGRYTLAVHALDGNDRERGFHKVFIELTSSEESKRLGSRFMRLFKMK